jgi:hypothetical protein
MTGIPARPGGKGLRRSNIPGLSIGIPARHCIGKNTRFFFDQLQTIKANEPLMICFVKPFCLQYFHSLKNQTRAFCFLKRTGIRAIAEQIQCNYAILVLEMWLPKFLMFET